MDSKKKVNELRNPAYDGSMGIFEDYGEADKAHAEETVTNFQIEETENKCETCPNLQYCNEWTICP
jgi:hypothetical protein